MGLQKCLANVTRFTCKRVGLGTRFCQEFFFLTLVFSVSASSMLLSVRNILSTLIMYHHLFRCQRFITNPRNTALLCFLCYVMTMKCISNKWKMWNQSLANVVSIVPTDFTLKLQLTTIEMRSNLFNNDHFPWNATDSETICNIS